MRSILSIILSLLVLNSAIAKECGFFTYKETQRINIPHGVYWTCGPHQIYATTDLCPGNDKFGTQHYNEGNAYSYDVDKCQPNYATIFGALAIGTMASVFIIRNINGDDEKYWNGNLAFTPEYHPITNKTRFAVSIKW